MSCLFHTQIVPMYEYLYLNLISLQVPLQALLVESREQTKCLQFEVDDLKQKLQDAWGDIKVQFSLCKLKMFLKYCLITVHCCQTFKFFNQYIKIFNEIKIKFSICSLFFYCHYTRRSLRVQLLSCYRDIHPATSSSIYCDKQIHIHVVLKIHFSIC